jgi:hypothetical protein
MLDSPVNAFELQPEQDSSGHSAKAPHPPWSEAPFLIERSRPFRHLERRLPESKDPDPRLASKINRVIGAQVIPDRVHLLD